METTALDLYEVAVSFFSKDYTIEVLGLSSGYSDSLFAQVTDAAGKRWYLRRWPRGMSEARLQFIHRVLSHSRADDFDGVPVLCRTTSGSTFIKHNGYLYDAQEWMTGKPPGRKQVFGSSIPNRVCQLGETQLRQLVRGLAAFHLSTAGLHSSAPDESTSLNQRFTLLKAEFDTFRKRVTVTSSSGRKWLERLPHLLSLAETLIKVHPQVAHSTPTLCHGDLWASHVFFDGRRFIGFADFESLCFSLPIVDLAQLVLHFADWRACERIVQDYEAYRSLSAAEVALLPAAAALDLVAEGLWSIEALHLNGTSNQQRRIHQKNLLTFFPSVELLLQRSYG